MLPAADRCPCYQWRFFELYIEIFHNKLQWNIRTIVIFNYLNLGTEKFVSDIQIFEYLNFLFDFWEICFFRKFVTFLNLRNLEFFWKFVSFFVYLNLRNLEFFGNLFHFWIIWIWGNWNFLEICFIFGLFEFEEIGIIFGNLFQFWINLASFWGFFEIFWNFAIRIFASLQPPGRWIELNFECDL